MQGPFSDGRKIALVIYGGTMTAVRAAGALTALEEMKLGRAFDSIYTVSAGFPCASYFLAGQSKIVASVLYQDFTNSKFLNFFRLWKMVDTEYGIRVVRDTKPLNVKKMLDNPTKLYVGLFDPFIDSVEYLEVHDFNEKEYFELLKASVSVPYLCPGDVHVRGKLYEDMPFKVNYHLNHVMTAINSGATDILVLFNYYEQRKYENTLPEHVYELRPSPDWDLSRFETKTEPLKLAAIQMGEYVKQIFGEQGTIQLP
ncbi:MAG: hypothetical protein HYW51_02290 [Candidatus Doudnabacteria bacterium]|nr:hypothetical protein [Candidatus Doudnabacteria bacterium]